MNDKFTTFPTDQQKISCDFFPRCSGCKNQKDLFNHFKHQQLENALNRKVPFIVDQVTHYRHRAKLAIGGNHLDPKIGLYVEGSHEILPIPTCPLHTLGMNAVIEIIRQTILGSKITIYSEKTFQGILRYVQIVQKRDQDAYQLAFSVNLDTQLAKEHPFFEKLKERLQGRLKSLWLNEKKTKDNVIFSSKWELISGDDMLENRILNRPFYFHPATFCQVHLPIYERVLKRIRSWIYNKKVILELYAGIATIGKNLADLCKRIDSYEINPFAQAAFEKSQAAFFDENIRFYNKSSEEFEENDDYEIVLADPPRKGMSMKVLEKVLKLKKVNELFLLYCDCDAFLKDLKILNENGYELKEIESYLFFPGSDHIEILARLEKRI
jgi:23S rRNA (uracil1939-C5)-methyltransferase